jgi:hypothetical protein
MARSKEDAKETPGKKEGVAKMQHHNLPTWLDSAERSLKTIPAAEGSRQCTATVCGLHQWPGTTQLSLPIKEQAPFFINNGQMLHGKARCRKPEARHLVRL